MYSFGGGGGLMMVPNCLLYQVIMYKSILNPKKGHGVVKF